MKRMQTHRNGEKVYLSINGKNTLFPHLLFMTPAAYRRLRAFLKIRADRWTRILYQLGLIEAAKIFSEIKQAESKIEHMIDFAFFLC